MRNKNYYFYSDNDERVKDIAQQYGDLGYQTRRITGGIVVFTKAQPKIKPKKEDEESRLKSKRERDYGQARA